MAGMESVTVAVPDLVSNSYFPAIAAIELGCFADQGLDAKHALIFPNFKAYQALREGKVDFVAGPAHVALHEFPHWRGVKLLGALAQGMYWQLVMRADLNPIPGDLGTLKGRRIGAAPLVGLGLLYLLRQAGVDVAREGIEIVGVPGTEAPGVSFGVAAAQALAEGKIDGFWANGMGAENAVRAGIGVVVLDPRRGLGPEASFHYTMPVLAASELMIAQRPEVAAAGLRAVTAAQRALKRDPSLADKVGQRLFPPAEAGQIAAVVARDLPYYDAAISPAAVAGLDGFATAMGLPSGNPEFADVVATQFSYLWTAG